MDRQQTIQTAFRFPESTLRKLKNKARKEERTVNGIVLEAVNALFEKEDKKTLAKLMEKLESYHPNHSEDDIHLPKAYLEFTQEELDADPRLEYLVNKHLR